MAMTKLKIREFTNKAFDWVGLLLNYLTVRAHVHPFQVLIVLHHPKMIKLRGGGKRSNYDEETLFNRIESIKHLFIQDEDDTLSSRNELNSFIF